MPSPSSHYNQLSPQMPPVQSMQMIPSPTSTNFGNLQNPLASPVPSINHLPSPAGLSQMVSEPKHQSNGTFAISGYEMPSAESHSTRELQLADNTIKFELLRPSLFAQYLLYAAQFDVGTQRPDVAKSNVPKPATDSSTK